MNIEELSSSGRLRIALVGLWGAALLVALVGLWVYKLRAGDGGEVRERWPAASTLAAGADRPTLDMFAHPRCPCTRASLGELRGLLSRFAGRMTTHVVFMRPAGSSASWSHTDTWATASARGLGNTGTRAASHSALSAGTFSKSKVATSTLEANSANAASSR